MPLRFIVLAAGKGTRMKSALPKVLHPLAGKPLLAHVLDTAATLEPIGITVVIGHGAEVVQERIKHAVDWAMQREQLGTAHAVQQGLGNVQPDDTVLITYGDVPLTRTETFQALVEVVDDETIALLTLTLADPTGYGRILREGGQVVGVVEQKDARTDQLAISEVNAGVVAVRGAVLTRLIDRIDNRNAQGEYYLTDLFGLAVKDGLVIKAVQPAFDWEADGVNSRVQLARLERLHQRRIAEQLMDQGVTLADPDRIDVRGSLETGTDVEIDVGCVFIGTCRIGSGVQIGAHSIVENSVLGDGVTIKPHSVIEHAELGDDTVVGPFARLRPGTEMAKGARIGNFVETKNTVVGAGSKINHLSYVGDATLGARVNIGAGTITCNYDGAHKHRTTLADEVFIGSNSALVAPIEVGEGATVGAGSTLSRDVPAGQLVLTRAPAKQVDAWKRPTKRRETD